MATRIFKVLAKFHPYPIARAQIVLLALAMFAGIDGSFFKKLSKSATVLATSPGILFYPAAPCLVTQRFT